MWEKEKIWGGSTYWSFGREKKEDSRKGDFFKKTFSTRWEQRRIGKEKQFLLLRKSSKVSLLLFYFFIFWLVLSIYVPYSFFMTWDVVCLLGWGGHKLYVNLVDFSFLSIGTDIVSFLAIYFLSFELNETLFDGMLFQDIGRPVSLYSSPPT